MLKKTISYTDFNGNERTEDFYFNLTEAELTELEASEYGGLKNMLEGIIQTQDQPKIIAMFKKIILLAYGEKSPDGRRFVKNDEIRDGFSQTNAFSDLFIELATNEQAAIDFVNGIVPRHLNAANA